MKRALLFVPIALAAALLLPLCLEDAPPPDEDAGQDPTQGAQVDDTPLPVVGLEVDPASAPKKQAHRAPWRRTTSGTFVVSEAMRRSYARQREAHVAWQTRTVAEDATWAHKQAYDKAVLVVRNLRATPRQRMQALASLESQTDVAEGDAKPGQSMRQAHLDALYRRSGLTEGDLREVVLAALVYNDARTRRQGLARVKEHDFTTDELRTVLAALIRADEHSAWYTAEQMLDRRKLERRAAEDLITDWDSAFRDGATKRRRFLVGLGARLKPRPVRLVGFLESAMRDADRDVRAAAVNALARLVMDGDAEIDVLAGATSDTDERVAQIAKEWARTFTR